MSGFYRTYSRNRSHTGYADRPQYPGQAKIPPCAGCGRPAERDMGPFDIRRCDGGHVTFNGVLQADRSAARRGEPVSAGVYYFVQAVERSTIGAAIARGRRFMLNRGHSVAAMTWSCVPLVRGLDPVHDRFALEVSVPC